MDYKKHLTDLRTNLANDRMSLLVGSGLSKNVSHLFPNWNELLADLAQELYEDDISDQFAGVIDDQQKKAWLQRKIKQKGYLQLVSDYIRKKGMTESIVTYIEHKIPILQDRSGNYFLINDGKKERLTQEQLNLHRQLLELPWNNVYTTNYDPLLEASVNTGLYDDLRSKNETLAREISAIEFDIKSLSALKDKLIIERDAIPVNTKPIQSDFPIGTESSLSENEIARDSLNKRIYDLENQIRRHNHEKESKEKEFNNNEKSLNNCYTVVTNGANLHLKRNRNIIKLHGSLRNEKERDENKFEFDGDPRKQYVISVEDYDTYPGKHEAFTQLMRISLLQESYCLIGFSGDDPNFIAWIGWVRDLLHKHAARSNGDKTYKIYHIDVSSEEIEADRLLFNENHSIIRIPLFNGEVIEFLENACRQKVDYKDKYKSILHLLFRFLSEHENIGLQINSKDPLIEKQWRDAWGKLITYESVEKIRNNNIEQEVKNLEELLPRIGIPDLQDVYTHRLQTFLLAIENDVKQEANLKLKEAKLQLAVLAVSKYFVPVCNLFSENFISELLNCQLTSESTRQLLERNTILNFEQTQDDFHIEDPYNDILRSAFGFQFDELHDKLIKWNPDDHQLHLKAGFLAWFDRRHACVVLEKQIESEYIQDEQLHYSIELLSYFQRNDNFGQVNKRIERRKDQYLKAGYPSITEKLDALFNELKEKPGNILPFGSGRFSVSNTIHFGRSTPAKAPLQYLMVLIESGFPLSLNHMHLQKPEEWYLVFKHGFELYPLPFLYYSFQYGKEPVLRRMAQDVCFSEKLAPNHSFILATIAASYFQSKLYRRENILIFLAEMFRCLDPAHWEAFFIQIWNDLLEKKALFKTHNSVCENFISTAVRFIESEKILFRIIEDLLPFLQEYSEKTIFYLFKINQNILLTRKPLSIVSHKTVERISELITGLHKHSQNNLFALGNLNFLLTDSQRDDIHSELQNVDFTNIQNERVWRPIVFFARGSLSLHAKIKKAILNHPLLWDTGIRDNSVIGQSSMILLSRLINKQNQNGLDFSVPEVVVLYEKLKVAFERIQKLFDKRPEDFLRNAIFDFSFCLEEMVIFLDSYKQELSSQPDFEEVYKSVSNIYGKNKGYTDLSDGLSGSDRSMVVFALEELSRKVEIGEGDQACINLLLNKLLFQAQPAIEETLNYLAIWMEDEKNTGVFENNRFLIIKILNRFKNNPLPETDIAFVEDMLVRIAYFMYKFQPGDPVVNEWMMKGRNSRFNNIRQWIRLHEWQDASKIKSSAGGAANS